MSMISPELYVIGLKDADYDKLIKERNELIKFVQKFEKKKKVDDKTEDDWRMLPSPEVEYLVSLQYLGELCKMMADKYSEEDDCEDCP